MMGSFCRTRRKGHPIPGLNVAGKAFLSLVCGARSVVDENITEAAYGGFSLESVLDAYTGDEVYFVCALHILKHKTALLPLCTRQ